MVIKKSVFDAQNAHSPAVSGCVELQLQLSLHNHGVPDDHDHRISRHAQALRYSRQSFLVHSYSYQLDIHIRFPYEKCIVSLSPHSIIFTPLLAHTFFLVIFTSVIFSLIIVILLSSFDCLPSSFGGGARPPARAGGGVW